MRIDEIYIHPTSGQGLFNTAMAELKQNQISKFVKLLFSMATRSESIETTLDDIALINMHKKAILKRILASIVTPLRINSRGGSIGLHSLDYVVSSLRNIGITWPELDVIDKSVKSHRERKNTNEPLNEGLSHPCIVVDVQPAYEQWSQDKLEDIISFVNRQTGPVLMFVNAERDGLTDDTVQDVITYWDDVTLGPDFEYDSDQIPNEVNWNRFTIVDKGYGWFRTYMDMEENASTIIKLIRYMYIHRVDDARLIKWPDKLSPEEESLKDMVERRDDDPFIINWTSVAQLKKFNGAYIMGGARNECLREVELLMSAFNIKYKRIDRLVY